MRLRLTAALVFALATVLGLAPAAAAWEPSEGAVFNSPEGKPKAKWRIITHVEKTIRNTPKGETILIASYLFDRKQSVDAMIDAHKREVHVQVVLDGEYGRTHQARRLGRVLNRDNKPNLPKEDDPARWGPDESFLVYCQGSCRGGGDATNNHAKIYAFSKVGQARNVVMVSSSNLNGGGAKNGWNDLYTVVGKPAEGFDPEAEPDVYGAYVRIHREMAQDTRLDNDRMVEHTHGIYTSRFFPTVRSGRDVDPVYQDLQKVRCTGATGGAGRNGRTLINVAMFWWSGTRGKYLAQKLINLDRRQGCDVRVIYGAPGREVAKMLKTSAARGQIKLWDSRHDRNGDGKMDLRTHSKYMLINGRFGADSSSWRVHTGSQNWGKGSMFGGDENTLNVESRAAYGQYLGNWNFVRKTGSRRIGR